MRFSLACEEQCASLASFAVGTNRVAPPVYRVTDAHNCGSFFIGVTQLNVKTYRRVGSPSYEIAPNCVSPTSFGSTHRTG